MVYRYGLNEGGSSECYTYDLAGRVTKAEDKKGGGIIHCYQYAYDLQGNITKITESGNTETVKTGACMTSGNIGTLTSASMTYTKDNRLDTYNGQKVTYDEEGNMTCGPMGGVMTSFTHDCRNRLIKAGDTTYEYDAENTRTAVQTKDRRKEYIVDKEAVYCQALSITTYEKNLLGQYTKETGCTLYTYGNGLISQEDIRTADTKSGTSGKGYYL